MSLLYIRKGIVKIQLILKISSKLTHIFVQFRIVESCVRHRGPERRHGRDLKLLRSNQPVGFVVHLQLNRIKRNLANNKVKSDYLRSVNHRFKV